LSQETEKQNNQVVINTVDGKQIIFSDDEITIVEN
jgi:hypothetical protein